MLSECFAHEYDLVQAVRGALVHMIRTRSTRRPTHLSVYWLTNLCTSALPTSIIGTWYLVQVLVRFVLVSLVFREEKHRNREIPTIDYPKPFRPNPQRPLAPHPIPSHPSTTWH